MSTAMSRNGAIAVQTTEQGLPLALNIEPSELQRDPDALAGDILRLCKQAANRAGLARRAEFEAAGLSSSALALMGLPKPEDIARQEFVDEEEYETEAQSWLRQP